MNDILFWILGLATTTIMALFGYLLLKNISVLESLKAVVDEIVVRFAVHEEANKRIADTVNNLENRVGDITSEQVELKLKINTHETLFNEYGNLRKNA